AQGWRVYATARDDAALADLRSAVAVALRSCVARPERLGAWGWGPDVVQLDLAVYVAGVIGPLSGAAAPPTAAAFDQVMHTNVLGAMQVTPLVAPMLEAVRGKFIFISSGMGSIAEAESSYAWTYRISKAALNMAVRAAAFDYPRVVLAALSPGWVRTDMGGENAELSPQESVASMLDAIARLRPGGRGGYCRATGEPRARSGALGCG